MNGNVRGNGAGTDRRLFLKGAGASALGLFWPSGKGRAEQMRPLPEFADRTDRAVTAAAARGAADDEVTEALKRAAEAATDFSWLARGDTVLIKVVSNSANKYPSTTSPLAVRAMVKLLKERGAKRVLVGDKPGVQSVYQHGDKLRGSGREVMTRNGLAQAAADAGAEPYFFEEAGYDAYFGDRTEHEGHWKGELILPDVLNRADHVVLLPRVSRHVLAGTTLGLKAAVGWLRDDSRLELHRDAASFYEKAAEINDARVLRRKLRLILTVATRVQTSFGPDTGFAATPDPGLVIASESLLAHDMTALGFLLWCREHATPAGRLSWLRDPYQTFPGAMNRLLVGMIWGGRELMRSETYDPVAIVSPRTDPVLSRAAAAWGGMPRLSIEEAGGRMPQSLMAYILEKAAA